VVVAGATGVLGRQLVPLLVSAGHEVAGLARSNPGTVSAATATTRPDRVPPSSPPGRRY